MIIRCGKYCTYYCSTLYAHTGGCVLGMWEETFIEVAFVMNDYPELHAIRVILILKFSSRDAPPPLICCVSGGWGVCRVLS